MNFQLHQHCILIDSVKPLLCSMIEIRRQATKVAVLSRSDMRNNIQFNTLRSVSHATVLVINLHRRLLEEFKSSTSVSN